jgi:hypothetical protein
MELAARCPVHKRDVSFSPQSRTGTWARDTSQTLAATAVKLGVEFSYYLRDRMVMHEIMPPGLSSWHNGGVSLSN